MRDATWWFTRYILRNAGDHRWRRNSNSIVLELAPGVKLSIFDARYAHRDGEVIHSHSTGFHSRIVAGVMTQTRYTIVPESQLGAIKCKTWSFDVDMKPMSPGDTWLLEGPVELQRAGEEYCITAPELHRTWPEDGTVSLRTTDFEARRIGIVCAWPPDSQSTEATAATDAKIKTAPDEVPATMLNDIVANALHRHF